MAKSLQPTSSQLRSLRRRDPALARAMDRVPRYPGFPEGTRGVIRSHFHALGRAIVYQQLATKAAATIHARVCALTPGPGFPRPEQVRALPDTELRGAGLSRNKLLALRDLAARVECGELKLASIARRSDEAIIDALVEVRGIGRWSAEMFLIFRLGRLDVMPAGDLGVQEGLRILDGLDERPAPKDVLERGEAWRPLRTVGSWVLWRLTDVEPRQRGK